MDGQWIEKKKGREKNKGSKDGRKIKLVDLPVLRDEQLDALHNCNKKVGEAAD